jgi:hypothetical protein
VSLNAHKLEVHTIGSIAYNDVFNVNSISSIFKGEPRNSTLFSAHCVVPDIELDCVSESSIVDSNFDLKIREL